MIRLIRCISKRDDISVEEFRNSWNSEEYIELLSTSANALQVAKYSHQLTLQIEINEELMKYHSSDEPFDGIIEFWWDNAPLVEIVRSPEAGEVQKTLNNFEDKFIDRTASRFFFTEA